MEGGISVILVQFGVIFLAALVHASLQLGLSALLLLYHASLGKHIKKKTRKLASKYILGATVLTALLVIAAAFLIYNFTGSKLPTEALTTLVVIMSVLSVVIWFFYYRSSKSTELWLPKSVSKYINERAKITSNNTEAFSLGMLATISEILFSGILLVAAGDAILALPLIWQIAGVIFYAFISILPLLVLRFCIRHGRTVVDVQRWRMKNKNFLKVMSGFGYLTLAIFIVAFKIMGG